MVISQLLTILLAQVPPKHRVLVLTDIENEPDDAQSLVRFLTYANQWDVEGLIATTSVHQQKRIAPERIRRIVEAYGKVRDNLLLHEKGYPETTYLLGKIKSAIPNYGMNAVGPGNDSEGSEHIIAVVDKPDALPIWIPVWGGANCLAQALWKVQKTRKKTTLTNLWRNFGCIPFLIKTIQGHGSGGLFRTCFTLLAPVFTIRVGTNTQPGEASAVMSFPMHPALPDLTRTSSTTPGWMPTFARTTVRWVLSTPNRFYHGRRYA